MATIKAFTDILQSKKLAEFLPLESADNVIVSIGDRQGVKTITMSKETFNILRTPFADIRNTIPCWSVAALYNILPNTEYNSTTLSRGGWKIEPPEYVDTWFCEYEDGDDCTRDITVEADNPVDACVEVIIKLHKLNLL